MTAWPNPKLVVVVVVVVETTDCHHWDQRQIGTAALSLFLLSAMEAAQVAKERTTKELTRKEEQH